MSEQNLPGLEPGAPPPPPADSSPETTSKLLKSTVVVYNGGEEFEFAIPTTMQEIRIGSLLPRLRRLADPESAGESLSTIDQGTYFYLRSVAFFVACLQGTSAKWVYHPDASGKPAVAWDKWPPEATNRVLEIAVEAQDAVARFHGGGAAGGIGVGAEAVASGPDSGSAAV